MSKIPFKIQEDTKGTVCEKFKKKKKCYMCENETYFMDVLSEIHICSKECYDKLWDYVEEQNIKMGVYD